MARVRNDEIAAQACIRAALPGCSVEMHDDGSRPSMYDLKIVYPDGSTGSVEVTAAADASRTGLWKEVRKRSLIRQEPDLAGGWLVRILTSAQARDLDRRLPGFLRDLEQAGRTVIRGSRSSTDELSARAGDLRIVEAVQSSTDRPGSIYVMPRRALLIGWAVCGHPLATRCRSGLVSGCPTRSGPTTSASWSALMSTSGIFSS